MQLFHTRALLAISAVVLSVCGAPALANSSDPNRSMYDGQWAADQAPSGGPRHGRRSAGRQRAAQAYALAGSGTGEDDSPARGAQAVASAGSSSVVAEARRYIGTNPTRRRSLWCGAFMNMVLERTGHRRGSSDLAKSFTSYGQRVSGPQIGALAIMSRGHGGGHVGIVSGIDPSGNPIVVSGNHNNRVAESVYPRGRVFAYVLPGS